MPGSEQFTAHTANQKAKRLLLIDGLGALLTFALLLFVLAPFENFFGMPAEVLHVLASIAAVYAVYSFTCFLVVRSNHRTCLQVVAAANLFYSALTAGFVFAFTDVLTGWGIAYFTGEILVIVTLAWIEIRTTRSEAMTVPEK